MTLRINAVRHFHEQPFKKEGWIEKIEELAKEANPELEKALVQKNLEGKENTKHIRDSDIAWLLPSQEGVKELFEFISQFIGTVNTSNKDKVGYEFDIDVTEPLQYTVYNGEGAHYDWHVDHKFDPEPLEESVRKISFTILLNKPRVDFEGGEFIIDLQHPTPEGDPEAYDTVDLRQGDIVLFPSYHYHKVAPVTKGIRKSLVGWVRGPQWK